MAYLRKIIDGTHPFLRQLKISYLNGVVAKINEN